MTRQPEDDTQHIHTPPRDPIAQGPDFSPPLPALVQVVPIFCFDPEFFKLTPTGYPKTGPYRAQFLLESVADLKRSLR